MKILLQNLKEHPLNQEIYGDDNEEQLNELVQRIKVSNWIKPILITRDFYIVSGHRRVRAARKLGYTEIEYDYVRGKKEEQLELLLNENAYRNKSTLQKTKEAEYYRKIESTNAHERQVAGVNLGVSETQGRTNEIVAKKVGMSESSLKKALKVTSKMEETEDPNVLWLLGETLNENITSAANLADKPVEFLNEVNERINGDVSLVGKVVHELEQEEASKQLRFPAKKYQAIIVEYGQHLITELASLPINEQSDENSALFLWTLPPNLPDAIKQINSWGFRYKTAYLWNKDVMNEVSDLGELLLVASKGNPPMLTQTKEQGIIEKPVMVKEWIDRIYPGDKIQITLGEGWEQW